MLPEALADSAAQPHRPATAWHLAAVAVFALSAAVHGGSWLVGDQMPIGDFPGYVAQIELVRDALLEYGRVPRWCVECYGGTTIFLSSLREILLFPLALWPGPVMAAKLAMLLWKVLAGLGLYALVARWLAAPAAGIVAGYVLAFGAIANHQLEHLDLVLATALVPPSALAGVALLRRGGFGPALALGVLTACQLANQWVLALTVPVMIVLLALFRPWESDAAARSWPSPRQRMRWAIGVGGALVLCAAFAASPLAWIVADAPHHRLIPEESAARQRQIYIERSPFLFVNRDNALASWLVEHQPPGLDVVRTDGGRRYVGWVVLAACGLGALAARRAPRRGELGRWAAVAGGMALIQYGLALGPRTLLWEVATSLHASPAAQEWIGRVLGAAAALLGAAALGLAVHAARTGRPASRRWTWRLGLAAVAVGFPVISLWSVAATVLPMLEVQRSPGRFFDTAPVWIYLLFAIALVALERRLARPRLALALAALVGAAAVVDFAPSRRTFEPGTPLPLLRRVRERLAALPGDGGTLRLGLPIVYAPLLTWVAETSPAGATWGWVPWQSGRHWVDLVAAATYAESGPRPDGSGPIEPDAALLDAMRVRAFLLGESAVLPPPWRATAREGPFALWEQPEVGPFARAYRAVLLLDDESRSDLPKLVSRALSANTLAISAVGSAADPGALRRFADALVAPGLAPPPLPLAPAPSEVPVRAREPERIALEVEAGPRPAVVSLSEGYHPWWRATVDGAPAPVLRANLAMLAVRVPAGTHVLELRFVRPFALAAADTLSAAAWIALAIGGPLAAARAGRRAIAAARAPRGETGLSSAGVLREDGGRP